jgi:hypothetical protein
MGFRWYVCVRFDHVTNLFLKLIGKSINSSSRGASMPLAPTPPFPSDLAGKVGHLVADPEKG